MPERVSITRARFNQEQDANLVEAKFRNEVAQHFRNLKQQGDVDRAFFILDRKGKEAIGITIYKDEATLKRIEGKRGRDAAPQELEDESRAPTPTGKERAKRIKESTAKMEKTEWYELIAEI